MTSKKKEKTLDELLEETLVPKEEQPYELPDNWIWTTLFTLLDKLESGKRPKGGVDKILEGIPSLGGEHLNYNGGFNFKKIKYVSNEFADSMTKGVIKLNDILIVKDGATTGKTSYVGYDFPFKKAVINEHVFLCRTHDEILSKYLFYYIISPIGQKNIANNLKGSAQGGINLSFASNFPVPLPGKEVQKSIVKMIEKLFIKINKAQQLMEEAKETFELRRAAILDMAFRGGRTRDFEDLPEGWKYKKFNDIATVKSNLVNPNDYLDYPHIAPDNIEKHTGRLLEYKSIREDNVKSAKHYFKSGAILYSKIRPYLSKVAMVDFEGLCSADMYPVDSKLNSKYLYWFMLSPLFLEQATTAGSRSVLPKINQKELGKILVPVCSNEEQEKTVEIIESVLKEESITLGKIQSSLNGLNSLKQSILSKAFQGKLGAKNPNDEPAFELLKSILQEKL